MQGKLLKIEIWIVVLCLLVLAKTPSVEAAVKIYKITDAFTVTSLTQWNNGFPYFNQSFSIPYTEGKMLLSSNPDGTGAMTVGDTIQVFTDINVLTYRGTSTNCLTETPLPASDITNFFRTGHNNVRVKLSSWCVKTKSISPLYLVNYIEDKPVDPEGPEPFLELPWNYAEEGKTFEEVVFNPNSWFDHQYPLQNTLCCVLGIRKYTGEFTFEAYKSHSGYDYGLRHGIRLATPVLAAADGIATFLPALKSGGMGNVIKIDHKNGYQTWYQHLDYQELVVSQEGQSVAVLQGDTIGKVGMTGNTTGPHIHFSVLKDANGSGTFDDDFPYGLVDPLGWEGKEKDPWEVLALDGKTGSKSYNLFTKRKPKTKTQVATSGALVTHRNIIVNVPPSSYTSSFDLTVHDGPFESTEQLASIGTSFFLEAKNFLGQNITVFQKPLLLTYSYEGLSLLPIREETLKMFFFNETSQAWEVLPSTLDKTRKVIEAVTTHFTHFAVMGDIKDMIAPTTKSTLSGEKGENGWYRSDVQVVLSAEDNSGGVGLAYTLYTLDGEEWHQYTGPIAVTEEGKYTISYKSYDLGDNREDEKKLTFMIDKDAPEVSIYFDTVKATFVYEGKDASGSAHVSVFPKKKSQEVVIADQAGNTSRLLINKKENNDKHTLAIVSLQYGNMPVQILPKNELKIHMTNNRKTGQLQKLEQILKEKNADKVTLEYNEKVHKTSLVVYAKRRSTTLLPGVVVLKLSTKEGKLEYLYQ